VTRVALVLPVQGGLERLDPALDLAAFDGRADLFEDARSGGGV
jgi:hypothetical protein